MRKVAEVLSSAGFVACALLLAGCTTAAANRAANTCEPAGAQSTLELSAKAGASSSFWQHWGDGKAELSGYRITTMRYGQPREGQVVLIYVTEPLDKRTLIKDDKAPREQAIQVLKLNQMLKFDTGIYPYSLMTSVFSAVDDLGKERFSPLKIAFSGQEWCGHVYHQVRPAADHFLSNLRSYFASEGDRGEVVSTAAGVLYEDALLIQLRELDGPFAGGGDWSGELVPALWEARKAHRPLRPVAAQIKRSVGQRDGVAVTRFELRYGDVLKTYEVEKAFPRRVLAWQKSDGERASIAKTARLPYWSLHDNGDEKLREKLGL